MSNQIIADIQRILGIEADGHYGPVTQKAYDEAGGLYGIAGTISREADATEANNTLYKALADQGVIETNTDPNFDRERFMKTLIRDEGLRVEAYLDTENIPTVGIGTNLRAVGWKGKRYDTASAFNADYPDGITEEEAIDAATSEVNKSIHQAVELCNEKGVNWQSLSGLRKEVLVNMVYNMGKGGLAQFNNMWMQLAAHHYEQSAEEMMRSRWSKQVGERADRLSNTMATNNPECLNLV